MVQQGQPAEMVWDTVLPYLRQGILTGHNLAFDYAFLAVRVSPAGQKL